MCDHCNEVVSEIKDMAGLLRAKLRQGNQSCTSVERITDPLHEFTLFQSADDLADVRRTSSKLRRQA